jgi:hypothetical protein
MVFCTQKNGGKKSISYTEKYCNGFEEKIKKTAGRGRWGSYGQQANMDRSVWHSKKL